MPIQPHELVSKIRIKVGNYRSILRRGCKGIKKVSKYEIAVMSRGAGDDGTPKQIATFRYDEEDKAVEFYRNHITESLKKALQELKKESPNDLWLSPQPGDTL